VLIAAPVTHAEDAKPSDSVGVPVASVASEAPSVRYPPPSVRWKLAGLGVFITGAAWGASFATAQNWSTVPGAAQLKIPVVGPWIALGKSGCAADDVDCSGAKIGVRAALYVIDGIAQIAGLALITEAIVMKTEPAREKKETSFLRVRYRGVEVTAVPVITPSMNGVGFVGTF
jgi:hypothetical protein